MGKLEDEGGIPDVPQVDVETPHWKVSDGMLTAKGEHDYIIGQIAVVDKGANLFDVVFFDTHGEERGRLHLRKDELTYRRTTDHEMPERKTR